MFHHGAASQPENPRAPFGRNLLLRSLAPNDLALVSPHFERLTLARGQVLFEPGDDVTHVTFPLDSTVATMLVSMQDGRTTETATVGHEGAIGGVVSQGYLPAFNRAVVQIGGPALRIGADRLQRAKKASDPLRNLLTRYADCLLAQVLQSVACNSLHTIEQRSAKWLLSLHDRLGSDRLPVTQDMLADMLGVGRTYVNGVLRRMQDQGMLTLRRGTLTLVDHRLLEHAACECHVRVREHFAEVLGAVYAQNGTLVAVDPTSVEAPTPNHVA